MIDGYKLMMSLNDWWYSSFGYKETEESKAIKAVLDKVAEYVEQAEQTEPQTDCYVSDLCKHYGDKQICGRCRSRNLFCEAEPQPRCPKCGKIGYIRSLESMGVKLKIFDEYKWKCTNCNKYFKEEPKDKPQTERIKTLDYCDICNHKGCDNCVANNLDDYCVPSGYEPTTQTETQNSNFTFEKDECAKEYEELGLKELKELINADRKDEPHTDCAWK